LNGSFVTANKVEREQLDWGELGWITRPSSVGARHLTTIEVTLEPGKGHDFHKHPDQEEIIHVVDGEIEQWLEREKRILEPGDTVFIPVGVVHASFNVSDRPTKLMVVLGPCMGEGGYEVVEVADQAPWNSLR